MKFIIALTVILALSKYANTAAAACVAASFCQTCASGSTSCGRCYSYAQGTNANKTWATQNGTACSGTLSVTVTNCLYYTSALTNQSNIIYAGVTTQPSTLYGNQLCTKCNGQKFLTWSTASTASGNTCTDTAPTMASGTCAEISNCRQTYCLTNATSNSVYCGGCSNGAWPATAANSQITTCTTTQPSGASTNCYYSGNSGTGTTVTHTCWGCNTGYALNSSSVCTAHTASEGCMYLQTDSVNCSECWPAYYFSGALCVLKSFVGVLVGLAAFVTLLIVQ